MLGPMATTRRRVPWRARVQTSDFSWIKGEDLDGGRTRSRVPSRYGIALAILDDDPGVRPAAHSNVASKAQWFTITDDLPQFPESRGSAR